MMLPPGSTIGILGGGQLGRMLSLAAANLGYRTHVFAPDNELPAAEVSAAVTRAAYVDAEALEAFAADCDVITYEFENVPADAVRRLARLKPVRPGVEALEVAQDRAAEKRFCQQLGGRPAPWRAVASLAELEAALQQLGSPAILKTRREGYDGKGQVRLRGIDAAAQAFDALGGRAAVLESLVHFAHEFSILVVRGIDGRTALYDPPENRHRSGILAQTVVPAAQPVIDQFEEASALARRAAEALDYVGVLCLEFFATEAGPVFNEMAPRVHNSGHWTIEGARVSQFENHIRAICGLPLGSTAMMASGVRMENLLGDAVHDWAKILADPGAHLHLYGKSTARPGRKMGHVTWLND
jgi:5-(carboxyamino)imidazole ribonucleotide synthase